MIPEIFVPLCEGYEISIFGRIKSLPKKIKLFHGAEYFTKERILKPRKGKEGYCIVAIFNKGKRIDRRISRLMGEIFIPNPFNKLQINHRNGNRSDDHILNLEWSTPSENMKHSYAFLNRKGAHLGKFGFDHIATKKIINIKNQQIVTISDAAKFCGVSKTHMVSMLKNIRTNWSPFKYYEN